MDIPLPAAESGEELDEEGEENEEEIDEEVEEDEEQDEEDVGQEESKEKQEKEDDAVESGTETSENEVVVSPRHSRAKSVVNVSKARNCEKKAFIKALLSKCWAQSLCLLTLKANQRELQKSLEKVA